MNIILWSALASIVVLAIYLYRPKTPQIIKIASAFLGGKAGLANLHLKRVRPPWVPPLLLALITLGLALAYWPYPHASMTAQPGQKILFWFDDSYSHMKALYHHGLRLNQLPLSHADVLDPVKGVLTNEKLERYVQDRMSFAPSALRASIPSEALENYRQNNPDQKIILYLWSDFQKTTLEKIQELKHLYDELWTIQTPGLANLSSEGQEIVPQSLLRDWQISEPLSHETSDQWVPYQNHWNIPELARPGTTRIDGFQPFLMRTQKQTLLLSLCQKIEPSSSYLDEFADLKVLASFLKTTTRSVDCEIQEAQAWKHRKSSLWVFPTTEQIYHELATLERIPFPQAYQENSDALVFIGDSKFAQEALIQWDEAAIPTRIFLSPEPGPLFSVSHRLHDGTPFAYQKNSEAIFYVRTTAALGNHELGRSTVWSQFWLSLLTKQTSHSTRFTGTPVAMLDPTNLTFKDISRSDLLGVYRTADNEYFYSDPDPLEFEPHYENPTPNDAATQFSFKQEERHHYQYFGACIAFFSSILLWFLPKKFLWLLMIFLQFPITYQANAQNLNSLRSLFQKQSHQGSKSTSVTITWCDNGTSPALQSRYQNLRGILTDRGTIELPKEISSGKCELFGSATDHFTPQIWWTDDVYSVPHAQEHIKRGGVIIIEGNKNIPEKLLNWANPALGLKWERAPKRGMLYRSFFLLSSFDGCPEDQTYLLSVKKKQNAQSPMVLLSSVRFLSEGQDCFFNNHELRSRSFTNLFYALLTTDYKEDQMQLPEILNKVRNLGLEP